MDTLLTFLKRNYLSLLIGLFFYLLYLQFTISGNRICDCETTEKYSSGTNRGVRPLGANRFYHK